MAKPFIRISGLKKHYQMGGQVVRALDGIDLEMEAHTFTVVMGPSGSGKSTLLYLLGGLDRPTAGEIFIDGTRLTEMDENALALFRRRTMGFVFQSFNLIQSMTALDNIAFPMQFAGAKALQRIERAHRPDRDESRPCRRRVPADDVGGQVNRPVGGGEHGDAAAHSELHGHLLRCGLVRAPTEGRGRRTTPSRRPHGG